MNVPSPGYGAAMLIVDLARLLRRRFETALGEVETGLTVGEARTLYYVWRNPGQRQAALADAMYVEPMTLVGYLDSLEKAGLIRRCPDPGDKRAKLIELTPLAGSLLERIDEAARSVGSRALNDFSEDNRRTLEDLLEAMKGSLLADDLKRKTK